MIWKDQTKRREQLVLLVLLLFLDQTLFDPYSLSRDNLCFSFHPDFWKEALCFSFNPDFRKEAMRALHFSHMKYSNRFGRTFIGLALVLLLFPSLTSSCTEQECTSLLRFLGGLSQDGNLTLTWKNGTDCCTWEGITCSPDRMVTDVFLAKRNLQGSISSSLGNLTGQLHLNLSYN